MRMILTILCLLTLTACAGGGKPLEPDYLNESDIGFTAFLTENNLAQADIRVTSDFVSAAGHRCKKFILGDETRLACGSGDAGVWKAVRLLQ